MQPFIVFLCKSTLISALLYGWYFLVLRNRRMNTYNRFYLLSTVVLSVLLPLLHFTINTGSSYTQTLPVNILQAISLPDADELVTPASFHFSGAWITAVLYGLVALALLAITLYKVAWIYKLRKAGVSTRKGDLDIIFTNSGKAPFSFFRTLFWRDTIDMESMEGRQIMRHELTHIRQYHSADKLFIQAAVIICWFNPVYWFIQKEISQVHEFIADEAAIEDSDAGSLAKMLLQCHYGHIMPHLVNPFFYSSIKRRIVMLNQKNVTKYAGARRLLVLPVLAGAAFFCSFTVTKSDMSHDKARSKVLVVLDAAHGGNDIGATGIGGVTEKDLTLKICKKMSDLASQYNIEVMQTREGDNSMPLDERVEKANAAKAGMFVSIHVNKNTADNPVTSGYEVITSPTSRTSGQSQMLAAAVISGIQQMGLKPVLVNKGIHVLKKSNNPAIAIECGRIDNAEEIAVLQDDAKLESLCRNILGGVVAYHNYSTGAKK